MHRQRFECPLYDGCSARVSFKATKASAAAKPTVFKCDPHMAHFAAVAMLAFKHFIVDDDPATDACSEGEKHHAFHFASGANPELAVRSGIGIVLKGCRDIEMILDVLLDGYIAPRFQIGWIEDDAGGNIHSAGSCHANARDVGHRFARNPNRFADGRAHGGQAEFLTFIRLRQFGDGRGRPSVIVHDAGLHGRSADVQTDIKRSCAHDTRRSLGENRSQ